jgi:predicted NUDIX family NTP pyrophosphohydrolase
VLLVRPGGPYWRNKSIGAWMIPKGGVDTDESPQEAAVREFREELGLPCAGEPFRLCRIRQSGGKIVEVFTAEGDFDTSELESMHFEMEWPRGSGAMHSFPEVEEARWMRLDEARRMMLASQLPIIDALQAFLNR